MVMYLLSCFRCDQVWDQVYGCICQSHQELTQNSFADAVIWVLETMHFSSFVSECTLTSCTCRNK